MKFIEPNLNNQINQNKLPGVRKTRASRTTGAKGNNNFASNSKLQITNIIKKESEIIYQ